MEFKTAVHNMFQKLGHKKIIALATSVNDHVTVRNVSGIIHQQRIFFKTDINFPKTQQLLQNPQVAICWWGIQIEGQAINHGLVAQQADQTFAELYQKYWDTSYTAYAHQETEILIEIRPRFAEIWDQDRDNKGFQTFIYFDEERAEIKRYD